MTIEKKYEYIPGVGRLIGADGVEVLGFTLTGLTLTKPGTPSKIWYDTGDERRETAKKRKAAVKNKKKQKQALQLRIPVPLEYDRETLMRVFLGYPGEE